MYLLITVGKKPRNSSLTENFNCVWPNFFVTTYVVQINIEITCDICYLSKVLFY